MRALMWFRSDLRVSDNTALHHACRSAHEGLIAVFAACPAQWSDHGWGSMKVHFILRNLQALSHLSTSRRHGIDQPEDLGYAGASGTKLDSAVLADQDDFKRFAGGCESLAQVIRLR